MRGEQLGEIDGVAGMNTLSEEAKQWQQAQHQRIAVVVKRDPADDGSQDGGHEVHQSKGSSPPQFFRECSEAQHTDSGAGGLYEAKGNAGFRGGCGILQSFQQFGSEVLSGHNDSPECRQPDHRQNCSANRATAIPFVLQQCAEAAGLFGVFQFSAAPAFRFLQSCADPDAEDGREYSQQIGGAPIGADGQSGSCGQPQPGNTGGMKNTSGLSPSAGWEDVRNQSRSDGPFAAHAHGHQKPQCPDLFDAGGKSRQSGEQRIEQDGQGHHRASSPAIGQ